MTECLAAGHPAAVAASVATLWTSPEAPRPGDAPALAATPDLPRWVEAMTAEDRLGLHGRTLTQLLLGDRVLIEEVVDGWARIVAPDQACPQLDPRGYVGWLPCAHLAPADGADRTGAGSYVVDRVTSGLREAPAGKPAGIDVVLGTRLTAAGASEAGHLPVVVPGRAEPLWAALSDLAPAPTEPPTASQVLEIARRLIAVPYVWGGVSPYGIDCSGLVHLAHRRAGLAVPRDAADQAAASRRLDPAAAQPGDLYFYARPGAAIHHVGFVTAGRGTLHASGSAGRVQHDVVAGELADMLVAVHRAVG